MNRLGRFGLGEIAAPSDVGADALAAALPAEKCPLALAPSSARGWFGGRAVVAFDPVAVRSGLTIAEAGDELEAAFEASEPLLVAVLAAYDGVCVAVRYDGALVLADDGWRVWGESDAGLGAAAVLARKALAPGVSSEHDPRVPAAAPLLLNAQWDMSGREYRAAVSEVRERIAAGDVYVLNLTARLSGAPALPPAETFSALLERAGSDMSAFVAGWPGTTPWIASVSPERFLRVRSGEGGARVVEVCPIKGTRPRGAGAPADAALAVGLLADEKERAEHVMVVDLERNDLGVVCATGTVRVDPLYEVVPTPYCHQLVSTVHGTLRSGATIAGLLAAAFPCGSVTGAPKRAAMRIAAELERTPRGAYCGSLLVAVPGELDSSVLIRSLEATADDPQRASWGAGCGVTHDSDPAAEYLETLLKATPITGDAPPPVALRETMRVAHGRVPLLDRHLARLASGGAGPSVLACVRAAIAEQLAHADPSAPYGRLGITVTPDGEVAAGLTQERSTLEVEGGPLIVTVEIEAPPLLPPHAAKPASRRFWDRAHNAARMRGADQALLVTPDGMLVDGSTANVWLLSGDELATPPAPPAVAGVMREVIFDLASGHGLTAVERPLTLADFQAADEVFLSNAIGGFVRARRL